MGKNATPPETGFDPSYRERILYLLKLSRPHWWVHLTLPVTFSVLYAADSVSQALSVTALWFVGYCTLPLNLFVYGVNDAFDADTDQYNERKTDDGGLAVRFHYDHVNVAAVLIGGLLAGTGVFVVESRTTLLLLAASIAAIIVYNVPPVRLKAVPFLDSFINGAFFFPPIAAYVEFTGGFPPIAVIAGFWLWGMGYHTLAAIEDIEADREADLRTLAAVLGRRRTAVYCITLWLVAPLLVGLVSLPGGLLFSVYPLALLFTVLTDRGYDWLLVRMFPLNIAVFGAITAGGAWTIVGT